MYVSHKSFFPTPVEFLPRSKNSKTWEILRESFFNVDNVTLSEESDTLNVEGTSISEFLVAMFKVKAILMAFSLDDYVSIGQF